MTLVVTSLRKRERNLVAVDQTVSLGMSKEQVKQIIQQTGSRSRKEIEDAIASIKKTGIWRYSPPIPSFL